MIYLQIRIGRRIYKSSNSGTSIFVYEGDNLVEETNASGYRRCALRANSLTSLNAEREDCS